MIYNAPSNDELLLGFSLKKAFARKPGGTFVGNLIRKATSAGASLAGALPIPGANYLSKGLGLASKLNQAPGMASPKQAPAYTPPAPTPAAAPAYVAPAPAPAASPYMASSLVSAPAVNYQPMPILPTSTDTAAASTSKDDKEKTKNRIIYGVSGVLFLALVVWLVKRKK